MFTNPSPETSISTSPSTASVPLRTLARRSRSSSCAAEMGGNSSRTSKMRRRLERATTMLNRDLPDCSLSVTVGIRSLLVLKTVAGVNFKQATNSTPLGGMISCRSAFILQLSLPAVCSVFPNVSLQWEKQLSRSSELACYDQTKALNTTSSWTICTC